LSLGLETLGGVCTRLIEKNTTIPTRKSEVFSTASDNQPAVEIHIVQGERQMARDNKSLGKFHLDGIPPAPRGAPQIEVSFDIDANGILNVSAKDLGTNKEQSIKITASSGLTEQEIQQMVKDAEEHAQEDKNQKEKIDAKNMAESLVYSTEKLLKENGDKISSDKKMNCEKSIQDLKNVIESNDASQMKEKISGLNNIVNSISSEMYSNIKNQQSQQKTKNGNVSAEGRSTSKDNVVDADFEMVDDKK